MKIRLLGMHFYKLNNNDQLIFVGANPAADKLLGVDNSQFIGKTIEEAFPPLIQTEVPERYRDAAAKGIPWSTEQIAYEDGQITGAFEVRAFQTTPGNMVAIFADITKVRQVERALRETRSCSRCLCFTLHLYLYQGSNTNQTAYCRTSDNYLQIIGISGRDIASKTRKCTSQFRKIYRRRLVRR